MRGEDWEDGEGLSGSQDEGREGGGGGLRSGRDWHMAAASDYATSDDDGQHLHDGQEEPLLALEDMRRGGRSARGQRRGGGTPGVARALEAYEWLQGVDTTPGVYVPQAGDVVVYLQQGHALYLDNVHDHTTVRPWQTMVWCAGVSV